MPPLNTHVEGRHYFFHKGDSDERNNRYAKKEGLKKVAYSLDEASAMTGLSKGHLRNENKRGKLELLKSSRRTLILASELNRYLSELKRK
jgi:hypothetical protein